MHPMLNTAIKAARKAGHLINKAILDPTKIQIMQKEEVDYVTNIDKECENEIINILTKAYPKHEIIAEESTDKENLEKKLTNDAEYTWLIDPIDGTKNFIHDFPFYSVSIGLLRRGRIHQAVVYDPHRDELFCASEGRGAYLNNKRIRVSSQEFLKSCLIATGFPTGEKRVQAFYTEKLQIFLDAEVNFRRTGSAALDLCYVAAGRTDGFFEKGLKAWDMAAGSLMVKEAGGFVGDFSNNQEYLYSGDVIAANPKLFPTILKILASSKV
ncbi:MAG: inositol monophosphatase [Burkholderiaceae bacterium]|nr:MAG: inositol monophosphatase [Burkholderiaceae bacterium]